MDTPEKNEVEVLNPNPLPQILMPERGEVSPPPREMGKKEYARKKQPVELNCERELCGAFNISEDENCTTLNNWHAL